MAVTDGMDQDLINTMTDEERAAINDDDGAGDAAALQALAADAGDDDDDDDDDAPADPAVDAAPAADPAPAPAADPAPAAAQADAQPPVDEAPDAATNEAAQPPTPVYEFRLPDDFAERKGALKSAFEELRVRRQEGDISLEEYDAEADKLAEQQRELDKLEVRADLAADMQRQHAAAQRTATANSVLTDAKKAGLDYSADEEKFAELRATMAALQNVPSHAAKGFEHVLREADRRVRLAHGIGVTPPVSAPPPAAPKSPAQVKAAAVAARKPDLAAAPTSLAQVPGGDGPGDVGGEFDHIFELVGTPYEDAIAEIAKNPTKWARFQAQMQ